MHVTMRATFAGMPFATNSCSFDTTQPIPPGVCEIRFCDRREAIWRRTKTNQAMQRTAAAPRSGFDSLVHSLPLQTFRLCHGGPSVPSSRAVADWVSLDTEGTPSGR
jgi:hypothetical protein